ncbi:gp41 protein [Mycobacteroides abscessus subsp. abscessus]|uniref:tyrosine-type recombinase/integrase n=1 Tax=Mycobacteroides abscessus TaxID=36809 RepID=UPI000927D880|nr:site-specific integrase [Mycobacteroides abscessus]SIL98932.1 gp41 protein [Mycobacteroides abscessus subsp. abscessus]SLC79238.1 gp41 protein [Mycobacteroides abscessus subsp. abscessus]
MARIPDYVKVVTTPSGSTRYQVRIETGKLAGKRQQQKRRFAKLQDAVDAYNAARGDRSRGVQLTPTDVTLRQAADAYLDALRSRPNTVTAYAAVLRPAIERLGDKPVQEIRREEFEKLATEIAKGKVPSGDWRKPANMPKAGSDTCGPWGPTSVRHMLARLRSVYARLLEDGTVAKNTAALVKPPGRGEKETRTLTVAQVQALFDHLEFTKNRLEHVHNLAAQTALRRGEIAGLMWTDIDLDKKTITVLRQRVHSDAGAVLSDTKTDAGRRVLPIPATLLPVLKRAAARSKSERLAAGTKWRGTGYVAADEFGAPYYPTTLSALWKSALSGAGLPHVRLHDARHTAATLMHLNRVPIAVIAAVLGHTDASFTQRTYAHSQDEAVTHGMAVYADVLATRAQ